MSELITKCDFAGGATGWTPGTNWSVSGGQAIAAVATTNQFLTQALPLIKGQSYVVTFDVANYSAGDVRVSTDGGDNGTARSANGTFTETLTLTAAATLIRFGRSTSDFSGRIDNVSVQGLGSTIDEAGLSLAIQAARQGTANSPEAWVRMVMQAYAQGGTGQLKANVITLNEAGLAHARSVLLLDGSTASFDQLVRKAVTAFLRTAAL